MDTHPPPEEAPPPPANTTSTPFSLPMPIEPPVQSTPPAGPYASTTSTSTPVSTTTTSQPAFFHPSMGYFQDGAPPFLTHGQLFYTTAPNLPSTTLFPHAAAGLLPSLDASLLPGHGPHGVPMLPWQASLQYYQQYPALLGPLGTMPPMSPPPAFSAALPPALPPAQPGDPSPVVTIVGHPQYRRSTRNSQASSAPGRSVNFDRFRTQDVPSVWVKPFVGEQTLESRYGRYARYDIYVGLAINERSHDLPPPIPKMVVEEDGNSDDNSMDDEAMADFVPWYMKNNNDDSSSQEEKQQEEEEAEQNIPQGLKKPPEVARARMNLTALSQTYDLYFAAFRDEIHVYRPQAPPEILSEPLFVLNPPPSEEARLWHHSNSLDPGFPHQVNHMVIGDLGDMEILLLAYDDGDVIAYYTHQLAYYAENRLRETRQGGLDRSSRSRRRHRNSHSRSLTIPKPFFHETVGETAWGLAVHTQSRLIAVTSNLCEICVFAFALSSSPEDDAEQQAFEGLPPIPAGLTPAGLEQFLRRRDRNLRLLYPIGWAGSNMPSVAFASSLNGTAEAVVAVDVKGQLWAHSLWTVGAVPLKLDGHVDERAWGVLAVRTCDFLLTKLMPPGTSVSRADDPIVGALEVNGDAIANANANVNERPLSTHQDDNQSEGQGQQGAPGGGNVDADADMDMDTDDDDDNNNNTDRRTRDTTYDGSYNVGNNARIAGAGADDDDANRHLVDRLLYEDSDSSDADDENYDDDYDPLFPLNEEITDCWEQSVEQQRLITFPHPGEVAQHRAGLAADVAGSLVVCPVLAMAWNDVSPAELVRVLQNAPIRRDATQHKEAYRPVDRPRDAHAHLRRVLRRYALIRTYMDSVEMLRIPLHDAPVLARDLLRAPPEPEEPEEATTRGRRSLRLPLPPGMPLPWDLEDEFVRCNMVHYVPALRLVIAATAQGQVALLRPVRTYAAATRFRPRHRFRVEWMLRQQHNKKTSNSTTVIHNPRIRYPKCCLLGLAVSPVPQPSKGWPVLRLDGVDEDEVDETDEMGPAKPPFKDEARYWRLILHFMDHTVLQYYIQSTKQRSRFQEPSLEEVLKRQ